MHKHSLVQKVLYLSYIEWKIKLVNYIFIDEVSCNPFIIFHKDTSSFIKNIFSLFTHKFPGSKGISPKIRNNTHTKSRTPEYLDWLESFCVSFEILRVYMKKKYPLREYILGDLMHTTACPWHWTWEVIKCHFLLTPK